MSKKFYNKAYLVNTYKDRTGEYLVYLVYFNYGRFNVSIKIDDIGRRHIKVLNFLGDEIKESFTKNIITLVHQCN